jgi:hypothetical protein
MKQIQKDGFRVLDRREQKNIKGGGLLWCRNDSQCGAQCDFDNPTMRSAFYCVSGFCRSYSCLL